MFNFIFCAENIPIYALKHHDSLIPNIQMDTGQPKTSLFRFMHLEFILRSHVQLPL